MTTTTYPLFGVMLICLVFALIAVNAEGKPLRTVSNPQSATVGFMVFLIVFVLTMFAGFRHVVGSNIDEYAYRRRFVAAAGQPFASYVFSSTEVLDSLQVWLVSHLFKDSQSYLFIVAAVTYVCIFIVLTKYAENFELAVILLFLLNIVFVGFNTMQQVEASAVAFLSLPYLKQRKLIKYLIVILLATLIHTSSIVLVALYFIADMKPWSGKFVAVSAAFVVLMLVFNTIAPTLLNTLNMNEYDATIGTTSVKLITVLVAFLPLIFAFFTRSYYPESDRFMNTCINFTLIYAMIYLVALRNVYVARFAIFFQPWIIMYYTKAMTYLRKNNLSTLTYYLLVVGYGAIEIYFSKPTMYQFVLFS